MQEKRSRVISPQHRAALLSDLRLHLQSARQTPPEVIAGEIQEMGFRCVRCGDCCRGTDNSVAVFPSEVRRIMESRGETWEETAEPPEVGEWDASGNFHTLEWRLKKNGIACRYYDAEAGKCSIYALRPHLCRTYPFYIDEGILRASECRGLGQEIDREEALDLGRRLLDRYITEIEEAIALTEKYEDFERYEDFEGGGPREGRSLIVHDSEGCHTLPMPRSPGPRPRL